MTKLTADEKELCQQCYRETQELSDKIVPLFVGQHGFVMLMVISDLFARWMMMHDEDDFDHMVIDFHIAAMDRYKELVAAAEKEVIH